MPEKRPIKLTLIAATATHCGTNWIGKCQHLRAREMDARCDVFGHEWEYSDGDAMPGRLPACIAAEKEVNQERDRAIDRAEKAEQERNDLRAQLIEAQQDLREEEKRHRKAAVDRDDLCARLTECARAGCPAAGQK